MCTSKANCCESYVNENGGIHHIRKSKSKEDNPKSPSESKYVQSPPEILLFEEVSRHDLRPVSSLDYVSTVIQGSRTYTTQPSLPILSKSSR